MSKGCDMTRKTETYSMVDFAMLRQDVALAQLETVLRRCMDAEIPPVVIEGSVTAALRKLRGRP